VLNGNEIYITASIGIYLYDGYTSVELEDVVRHSDEAMYAVKTTGRNGFRYFGDS
jgi:GGDEF domain-containing protein